MDGMCPLYSEMIIFDLVGGGVIEPKWSGFQRKSNRDYGRYYDHTETFILTKEDVDLLKQHNIENIYSPDDFVYDIDVINPELYRALLVCLNDLHFGDIPNSQN